MTSVMDVSQATRSIANRSMPQAGSGRKARPWHRHLSAQTPTTAPTQPQQPRRAATPGKTKRILDTMSMDAAVQGWVGWEHDEANAVALGCHVQLWRITTITLVGMADGLNSGAGTSHCPSDVAGRLAGGLNSGAGTGYCPSDVAGRGRVHSRSSTVCNRSAGANCTAKCTGNARKQKKDIDGITLECD